MESRLPRNNRIFNIEKVVKYKGFNQTCSKNALLSVNSLSLDISEVSSKQMNTVVSSKANFKKSCEKFRNDRLVSQYLETRRLKKLHKKLLGQISQNYVAMSNNKYIKLYKVYNEMLEQFKDKKNNINEKMIEELLNFRKCLSLHKNKFLSYVNGSPPLKQVPLLCEKVDCYQKAPISLRLVTSDILIQKIRSITDFESEGSPMNEFESSTNEKLSEFQLQKSNFCPLHEVIE